MVSYDTCVIILGCTTLSIFSILIPKIFPTFFSPQKLSFTRFLTWVLAADIGISLADFFLIDYANYQPNTLSWLLHYSIHYAIPCAALIAGPFALVFFFIFHWATSNSTQPATNNLPLTNIQHVDYAKQVQPVLPDTPIMHDPTTGGSTIHDIMSPTKQPALISQETTLIPQLSTSISHETTPIPNDRQMLRFTDNSGKNELRLPPDKLCYIASSHNYVEIFYLDEENKITRNLMRSTLKSVEEQFLTPHSTSEDSPFFRCHNAFIVNASKIVAIRGKAQSRQIILEGIETLIPVSRLKTAELKVRAPDLF